MRSIRRLAAATAADTGFLSTVSIRAGLAVQNDGKILVSADHLGNFALARFDASGTLDPGFGTGGKVVVDLAPAAEDHANAVTVVPANLLGGGKIVAAGLASDGVEANFAVARFLPDGTLDASFGSNGVTIVDASGAGGYDAANAVALEVDGLGVKGCRCGKCPTRRFWRADGGHAPLFHRTARSIVLRATALRCAQCRRGRRRSGGGRRAVVAVQFKSVVLAAEVQGGARRLHRP